LNQGQIVSVNEEFGDDTGVGLACQRLFGFGIYTDVGDDDGKTFAGSDVLV
jgi:hypothetical protein